MFVPEVVYQFTSPKDFAQGALDVVNRRVNVSGAVGTTFEANLYTVPKDKVFVLSRLFVWANANTGVNVSQIQLRMFLEGGNVDYLLRKDPSGFGTANQLTSQISNPIWIPPGARLTYFITWSASDVLNESTAFLSGINIPRGNAQQS